MSFENIYSSMPLCGIKSSVFQNHKSVCW